MLELSLLFLFASLIAAALGFGVLSGPTAAGSQFAFLILFVLFLSSLIASGRRFRRLD